jgi:hypothetical protein
LTWDKYNKWVFWIIKFLVNTKRRHSRKTIKLDSIKYCLYLEEHNKNNSDTEQQPAEAVSETE